MSLKRTVRWRVPRRLAGAALLGLTAVALSGCTGGPGQVELFGLPLPSTEQGPHMSNLWVGAWIASLIIGVLVWGLMGWAFFRYRRRHSGEVPKQTRYNLPMEIMYTIVPFLIVGVLFFYTVQTQNKMLDREQTSPNNHTVGVVAQKWSWTFNYVEEDVWDAGTIEQTPDLYLPIDEVVTFTIDSPDVIHSFWVPSFYMKMDAVPGRTNTFQATPNKLGVFAGKCAELCGTYHSAMLFNLHVVTQEEFDAKMEELRAKGQTGQARGAANSTTIAQTTQEGE